MTKLRKSYYRLLTIAGSDCGGGAGIQADLKTFSALGCFGLSVITALTAQNTKGVSAIFSVSADFVAQQLDAVLLDIGTDAIKIGMLHNENIIAVVAEHLNRHKSRKIVLDPVMVAKSGDSLLSPSAVKSLVQQLFPIASLITPNIPEAETLLGRKIVAEKDMEKAARDLLDFGSEAVLLKGGHLSGPKSSDLFLTAKTPNNPIWLHSPRIESNNLHGTGCTLSAAIAAFYAQSVESEGLLQAVQKAKKYLQSAIEAGCRHTLSLDQLGNGPLHHFWNYWD